jgi:DNA-binding Xre family transcriptional regulator
LGQQDQLVNHARAHRFLNPSELGKGNVAAKAGIALVWEADIGSPIACYSAVHPDHTNFPDLGDRQRIIQPIILVAQKELREKRRIGIRTIVDETGATRSAVQRLLNNTIREVPLDALALLCEWVPCLPGDILRLEPMPEAPEETTETA